MICEIHITISHSDDLPRFKEWCQSRNLKPIKAVSTTGNYPIQPMTSKYVIGDVPYCIQQMHNLSQEIKDAGFKVLRDKLEVCCGTPDSLNGITSSSERVHWEAHFKIEQDKDGVLEELLKKYPCTGVSVNEWSKTSLMPLVTVRVPCDTPYEDFVGQTDIICNQLVAAGITLEKKRALELAVYDSFRDMDKHWLLYT
jgi:hypothetical protein